MSDFCPQNYFYRVLKCFEISFKNHLINSKKKISGFKFNMKLHRVYFTKKYATGSLAQRYDTLQKYSSQIYSAVMDKYDATLKKNNWQLGGEANEFIPLHTLEKIIKKIFPEKLSFKIKQKKDKVFIRPCAAETINYYINSHFIMTKINLPATNRKLNIDQVPILMHEITHLLDFALNPIIPKIDMKLCKKRMYADMQNWYYELLYTDREIPIEQIENEIKKILRYLSIKDKLLVLKYFKLYLNSEKKAYEATKIYCDKLRTEHCRNLTYDDTYEKKCRIDEKIKLINKIRYEIISEGRKWYKQVICRLRYLNHHTDCA